MTFPKDPHDRLPRGDKNRRISLGIDRDEMARTVGVTPDQLRAYEFTQPDRSFDVEIARRVGITLERLETRRQLVGDDAQLTSSLAAD
jgi:hypothetical protein